MLRSGMLLLAILAVVAGCQAPGQAMQHALEIDDAGRIERLTLGSFDVPLKEAIPFSIRHAGDDAFQPLEYEGKEGGALVYRAGDRYRLRVKTVPVGNAVRI